MFKKIAQKIASLAAPKGHDVLTDARLMEAVGDYAGAANFLMQASTGVEKRDPQILGELARVLIMLSDFKKAGIVLQEAMKLAPQDTKILELYAKSLLGLEMFNEAAHVQQAALKLKPDVFDLRFGLGEVFFDAKDFRQLEKTAQELLLAKPDHAGALAMLALALRGLGKDEARVQELIRQAVARDPDGFFPNMAAGSLAGALKDWGVAEIYTRRAFVARPWDKNLGQELGYVLAMQGKLKETFQLLEYIYLGNRKNLFHAHPPEKEWDGKFETGKHLCAYLDQGFGDAIMCVRYVPLIAAKGMRVSVAVPRQLESFFKQLPGVDVAVFNKNESSFEALPQADFYATLYSLPRLYGTDEKNIPADIPYLSADAAKVEKWREILKPKPGEILVGLCPQGNPSHADDHNRSIHDLKILSPFKLEKNIRWISLQPWLHKAKMPFPIEVFQFESFSDTAGLVELLDAVVTIDSAPAHLAGAMGKPTFVMLGNMPDWRWMDGRDDSPWYPTIRLFRQKKAGDWPGVIADVRKALAELAGQKKA